MCATKLFTMRTPTEEHFQRLGELDNSGRQHLRNSRAFPSYQPEQHLLSRQTGAQARNPSVPTLLNVDTDRSGAPGEQQQGSSRCSSVSVERAPAVALAVETSPLTQEPRYGSSGHFITPPASSTRVQFKTPVWQTGSAEYNGTEPAYGFKSSSLTPTRHRQSSMESLMRAAATVESDVDLNRTYQDKVASIIELKNKVSNSIRNWPVAKDSLSQGNYSAQNISDEGKAGGNILLDQISSDNLTSLDETTRHLGNTVKELVNLKKHVRYIRESAAAIAQTRRQSDASERRVTLPPIGTLTMNIPQKPPSKSFQFPPEEPATSSVGPTAVRQQSRSGSFQSARKSQDQPASSRASSGSTWPTAFVGHRPTLSDPSGYRPVSSIEGPMSKVQYSKPVPVPLPVGARPIIVNPQGNLQSPIKIKSKAVKKRKKSLVEKPSQDYRVSLTHGLLLTEPTKKEEQSTTSCVHCGENSTPEWRRGPYGNRTLCNACGLFYRKLIKKFGTKDANMLMRFKRQINPEDRRVPSILNVPAAFIASLDSDSALDVEYNTIGGTASSGASGL